MTWDDFLVQLGALGLTQRDFAARVGLREPTISRWRHAERGVPIWARELLAAWLTLTKAR